METEITMKLETVTPKMAKEYLLHNAHNRKFQKKTAQFYARLMVKGEWTLNGDTIRFDLNGDMIDGQHRLFAIIESGISLTTYVVRGLPSDAQLTIDQQRKRTAGDILSMRGITNGNRLAAIVRMTARWDGGERSMYGFGGNATSVSAKEIVELVQTDPVYIEACRVASLIPLLNLTSSRVTGTMYVLFERIDPVANQEFFDRLIHGHNLADGSPILTLRRYWLNLSRNRRERSAAPVFLKAGVHAWNALAEGRMLEKMSYKGIIIPEISIPNAVQAPESVSA